ncbi:MAG: hypothetical protein KBA15_13465 [Spirochaetes bacterium]|nr:hypothetical protein [Spirochaetota bacterium]
MTIGYEKDYDDEVYEDEYYEEHFDDEELIDDEGRKTKGAKEDEEDEEDDEEEGDYIDGEEVSGEDEALERDSERRIETSYACDDCDYRWDDVVIKRKDVLEDYDDEPDTVCPMCGSVNISII